MGEVLRQVQEILDAGLLARAIEDRLGVKADTIRKPIEDGRFRQPKKGSTDHVVAAQTKDERSPVDQEADDTFGVACHDVAGRTLVALGEGGPAEQVFTSTADLPGTGVLCAIPALVANALFHDIDQRLAQPPGY